MSFLAVLSREPTVLMWHKNGMLLLIDKLCVRVKLDAKLRNQIKDKKIVGLDLLVEL